MDQSPPPKLIKAKGEMSSPYPLLDLDLHLPVMRTMNLGKNLIHPHNQLPALLKDGQSVSTNLDTLKAISTVKSLVTNPNLPSTRNASGEGRDSGGGFVSRDAVLGEEEGRLGKRVGKIGKD